MGRVPWLAGVFLACFGVSPALAEVHGTVAAGGFVAAGGPSGHGPAVELEVYPGGAFGRVGLGMMFRDFAGAPGGMVAAGVVFAAGATRPHLVMSLHGEVGVEYASLMPVAGGGVRAYLGLGRFLPNSLALGSNLTGHVLFDGAHPRLALAWTVTLGLAF